VRVQHRHIVYVQGYDPRGLAQYYRMFRTELRKFGRLYQVGTTIGRPQVAPDGETASWTIETKASDWQTRTAYDFLRWEDLIQRDLAAPIWGTVFKAMWIYWRLVFGGTIARFWRAHWRFATFISYPHFLLFNEAIWSAAIAFLFGKGLEALGIPGVFSLAAAAVTFVAVLGTLLKYTENRSYLLYLLSDTIWTWEFAHRQRPEWDARIDRFAQYLVDVAGRSDAEEIVVVGHSSGSFLGAEILARALKLDPALGRRGPRIVLLTIGGNFPIVGTLDRLDRLPIAQRRDELLSVRSDHRPRHRGRRWQAKSHHRAGQIPGNHQAGTLQPVPLEVLPGALPIRDGQ
jgi:hypothetical protein